jgi:hypothetical protein
MNARSLRPRQTLRLTRRRRPVSPTPGLRSITNTQNIITNTNNTARLHQPDSTETGADQDVHQSGERPEL